MYRESAHAYRGSLLRLLERHAASLGGDGTGTGYVDVDTNIDINANANANMNINGNDHGSANNITNTVYQRPGPGHNVRGAARPRNSTVEVSFDLRQGYRGRDPVAMGFPARSADTNAARVGSLVRVRSVDEVTARMGRMRSRGLEAGVGQAEHRLSRETEGRGWSGEGGRREGVLWDTYPDGR